MIFSKIYKLNKYSSVLSNQNKKNIGNHLRVSKINFGVLLQDEGRINPLDGVFPEWDTGKYGLSISFWDSAAPNFGHLRNFPAYML